MSRNNIRGPTSALTDFLRESGITATTIARRARTQQSATNPLAQEQQPTENGAGPSSNDRDDEESVNEAGPSRRTRTSGDAEDYNSDHLDDTDEEPVKKKRKLTKAAETKLKAKAKKKAGKGNDEDNDDDVEDAYTALSKSMFTNGAGPKPPVGSFETCAKCEKQFTVTKYTMAAHPPPGFLCHQCAKASGADPFKKPAAPRKRKTPAEKRTIVNFEERRFPSLASLCIQVISKFINDVEALGDIGSANVDNIVRALSRNRSLTQENANLFYSAENTSLTLYDATKLVPDALSSLALLNPNLTNLRLDFCGRMNDEVFSTWSTSLPKLERIELLGPFLIRVPAWVRFFKSHPQLKGFLITQSPRFDLECIKSLCQSCKTLTELRLKEIGKLDDKFIGHLKKLTKLTHLDLSDPTESLSVKALIDMLSVLGPTLTHLDLSGQNAISDDFLKDGLEPHLRNITSLSLNNIPLLTDVAFASVFEAWSESHSNMNLHMLSLSRIFELGTKTLLALLSHPCASGLTHLNINAWRYSSEEALKSIGEKAGQLIKLDIGWNRDVDDFTVKNILEGCSKLEELKVWGCNKVTANCPKRRGVSIFGVESHTSA